MNGPRILEKSDLIRRLGQNVLVNGEQRGFIEYESVSGNPAIYSADNDLIRKLEDGEIIRFGTESTDYIIGNLKSLK